MVDFLLIGKICLHDFIPLITLYRHFNLPQHLFAGLADRHSQGSYGVPRVEVKYAHEVLMLEIFLRFQAAAGHERISDAHGGGIAKRRADIEIIIFLQKAPVNDTEDSPLVLLPIFPGKQSRDCFKLFLQTMLSGNAVAVFQRCRDCFPVRILHTAEMGRRLIFAAPRVGNIKHIAQNRSAAPCVNEGNSRGIAPDIPPHPLVPEIILRAGRGVRALGVDHQLLREGVFVYPRRRSEKRRPLPEAARET